MKHTIIKNVTISEEDAKDAIIHVSIKRDGQEDSDTVFSIVFIEESEGSLYLEVCEDSNPTNCIANNYPEFFTMRHTHGLTTTVDGEVI